MTEEEKWVKWLEFFYHEADFGPAHEDVEMILYEDFKQQYGITIGEFEEEE